MVMVQFLPNKHHFLCTQPQAWLCPQGATAGGDISFTADQRSEVSELTGPCRPRCALTGCPVYHFSSSSAFHNQTNCDARKSTGQISARSLARSLSFSSSLSTSTLLPLRLRVTGDQASGALINQTSLGSAPQGHELRDRERREGWRERWREG